MSTPPYLSQATPLQSRITRRTVSRSGLGVGVIAALLAAGVPRATVAEATPVSADDDAESRRVRYALSGDGTEIVFTPAVESEPARLEYRVESEALSFTGEEIDVSEHAALGQVISVLLKAAPDAFVDYLALLLPTVNPDPGTTDVQIDGVAVVIRHLTSLGGPRMVSGPLQSYAVRPVSGTASFGPA